MVLTHTQNHTYAHPFPTVTLAYFLRYCSPQINPFAAHVLSTDTISSHVDPATGRLHTTRIHLKKSRIPSAVVKLLPVSLTGGGGDKKSYVLETSIVDIKDGWMRTESRNLDFVGVLSVVEQQTYTTPTLSNASLSSTDVATTTIFRSRVGEKLRERIGQASQQDSAQQGGWLGKSLIQRSIESIASRKTQDQLGKSREGMGVVLERLRNTGVKGILELTRRTREAALVEGRTL
ncbi:PRELI-like family-domain-containing protein [Coniella lustricola]|uniref:PRELI-like family-domain-containing protein n=1 Tax=Coniella lustricola TaxID=2025994 RepID=A0A2T3AFT4_9PEZI|nr:PRELI-like family-domain-containing protein [Coniella lustricola]